MLENRADVTRTIQYVFEEGGLASDDYVEVLISNVWLTLTL
ncbi:MAG: hypothetical protein ACLS36_05465 [Streptococcus sp.]